jgi:hypothetical protein
MTLTEQGLALASFLLGFGVRHCYSTRKARQQVRENYLQFSALHGQMESLEKRLRQLSIDQPRNGQVALQAPLPQAWDNFAVSPQDSIHQFEQIHDVAERASKH